MCTFLAYIAFNTAIFNSDIQISFSSFSCFISVCPFVTLLKRQLMPKMRALFSLVDIKKCSFLTSCVFWFASNLTTPHYLFTLTARHLWRSCIKQWQIHSNLHWKRTQIQRSPVATSAPPTSFIKRIRLSADVCHCAWSKLKVTVNVCLSFDSFALCVSLTGC